MIFLGVTVEEASACGQQLFLANIGAWPAIRNSRRGVRRLDPAAARGRPNTAPDPRVFLPRGHRQLTLFDMTRDLRAARARGALPEPADEQMAAFLDAAVLDHARRHGWSKSAVARGRAAMRVLQGIQDTPGATLLASDAELLQQVGLPVTATIAVATAAGLMLDDRDPAIHAWFAAAINDLPNPMRAELREWFDVMLNGSLTPPRRLPRDERTIRHYLRWAVPALTTWARQGHTSLREITPDDVRAVLPAAGNPRSTMGAGLRSIFTLLKARKTIFVNPIARIRTGGHERTQPMPLDTATIQRALNSPNPACAAMAALAAFHGLRSGEVRQVHLTDVADGRIRVGERTIPLAGPARVRLAAWLDHRERRWPNTANPYLFVNHRNAGRITPVGIHWLGLTLKTPISVFRDDRILHEIQSTNGDLRRICALFGLTVDAALRYLPNPELDDHSTPGDTDEALGWRTRTSKATQPGPTRFSSHRSTLQ